MHEGLLPPNQPRRDGRGLDGRDLRVHHPAASPPLCRDDGRQARAARRARERDGRVPGRRGVRRQGAHPEDRQRQGHLSAGAQVPRHGVGQPGRQGRRPVDDVDVQAVLRRLRRHRQGSHGGQGRAVRRRCDLRLQQPRVGDGVAGHLHGRRQDRRHLPDRHRGADRLQVVRAPCSPFARDWN